MRICFLTRFFPPKIVGGGEISAYHTARMLSEYDICVHVVTTKIRNLPESWENHFAWKKLSVHRILSNNTSKNLLLNEMGNNLVFSIKNVVHLVSFFKKNAIDLIHIYNMDMLFEGMIAGKIMNIPVIVSANSNWSTCFHGNHILPPFTMRRLCYKCNFQNLSKCVMFLYFPSSFPNFVKYFLTPIFLFKIAIRRRLMRLTDKIIAVSNCVKRILTKNGIPKEKIHVIHNFFNSKSYQNINKEIFKQLIPCFPQKKSIIFVGRLKIEKGIVLFIKAAQFLVKNGTDANFVVIGSGPLFERLQSVVQTSKLNNNIFFTGNLPYKLMPSVYAAADIIVAPVIREEALSRVLYESMAASSPVIATKVCGNVDVVIDGVNGLLVRPTVNELSKAMLTLLNDVSLRKEMGRRGLHSVTNTFSERIIIPKIVKIYSKLIGNVNNASD